MKANVLKMMQEVAEQESLPPMPHLEERQRAAEFIKLANIEKKLKRLPYIPVIF